MKFVIVRHGQTMANILNIQGISLFTGALNNKYTELTEERKKSQLKDCKQIKILFLLKKYIAQT